MHNFFVEAFIHNIENQTYTNNEDFFHDIEDLQNYEEEVKEDDDRIIMDSDDSEAVRRARKALISNQKKTLNLTQANLGSHNAKRHK